MKKNFVVSSVLLVTMSSVAYGQGCSDAGFCTAGAMQGGVAAQDSTGKSSFGASISAGIGEKNTFISSFQLEGKLSITGSSFIEAKLPVNYANGNLGSHAGIGDPIITFSKLFSIEGHPNIFSVTLGSRIGTGKANATEESIPLPMPYQSTLGTTDVIAGANLKFARYFNLSAGYQQPIIQYNDNNYTPFTIYPATPIESVYFASKHLQRKGDVLLRLDGNYQWKKLSLGFGPLLIFHLGEDEYTNVAGNRETLKGSDGLTVNLAGSLSYRTKTGKFDLLAGTPVVVRDYRPDGLTRAVVITLRYTLLR